MTLVERIARELAMTNGLRAGEWRCFKLAAITVLKAMREPTEAMVAAGGFWGAGASDQYEAAIDKWQAMLDAALREADE